MKTQGVQRVLAVDPGRDKCGLAVAAADGEKLLVRVVSRAEAPESVRRLMADYGIETVLLGLGTGAEELRAALRDAGVEPVGVGEENTTRQARALYFEDHPPRGLLRLAPRGLLVPPEPVDGYAALVIARRFFAGLN